MATCEPIMILLDDLTIIDGVAKKRTELDLDKHENRKVLIQLRKEVIHELVMIGYSLIKEVE